MGRLRIASCNDALREPDFARQCPRANGGCGHWIDGGPFHHVPDGLTRTARAIGHVRAIEGVP